MSARSPMLVVGHGPVLEIARSIASAANAPAVPRFVEVTPDLIADTDLGALTGDARPGALAFAAVGLHALNHARSDLVARLRNSGFEAGTLVHASAFVDPTSRLAGNVLVNAGATIGPGCEIEEGAVVLDGARIEAGARVGAYAWIGANVVIGFGASVGAHTILRPGVNLDAGVPVGDHCELATPGLRQKAIEGSTFETPAFELPVRIFRAGRAAGA